MDGGLRLWALVLGVLLISGATVASSSQSSSRSSSRSSTSEEQQVSSSATQKIELELAEGQVDGSDGWMWEGPNLLGEWRAKDGSVNNLEYSLDDAGVVHFRGVIAGHKYGTVFTLPKQYAPSQAIREVTVTNENLLAYVDFLKDGKVKIFGGKKNNSWFTFSGMSYFAVPAILRDDMGNELPPLSPFQPAILTNKNVVTASATVGYFKDDEGFVHLRGRFTRSAGAGNTIFTVKNADKPAKTSILLGVVGSGAAGKEKLQGVVFKINPAGNVIIANPQDVPAGAWITMDGLMYRYNLKDLGWKPAQLQSQWKKSSEEYDDVGHFKDSSGFVHLRGVVSGGTDELLYTLPEGQRPEKTQVLVTATLQKPYYAVVTILPDGSVKVPKETVAKTPTISLDGLLFRVHVDAKPEPKCKQKCHFGGTLDEEECECQCVIGRGGPTCEDKIDPPCTLECLNDGWKDENVCKCDCFKHWIGKDCGKCGLTCKNEGKVDSNKCECDCPFPWGGEDCSTCALKCENDGTLDKNSCKCSCPPWARGPRCERTGYCYDEQSCLPARWGSLDDNSALCGSGLAQSPINIVVSTVELDEELGPVRFKYASGYGTIHNDRRAIFTKVKEAGAAEYMHQRYTLKKWAVHSPSEHTVDGQPVDMELQLHHQAGSGNYLIVSILFSSTEHEGKKATTALDQFLNAIPVPGAVERIDNLDAGMLAPKLTDGDDPQESRLYWTYMGSLTTPPCREGVRMIVMKNVLPISTDQLKVLHKNMEVVNTRPTQPMNGRRVQNPLATKPSKLWSYTEDAGLAKREMKDVWEENGAHQSPINIVDTGGLDIAGYKPMPMHHPDLTALMTRYYDSNDALSAVDNFLETTYTHRPPSSVLVQGRNYYLRRLRVHSPALHMVNGGRGDMELTLMHQHQDSERPDLMISVIFAVGDPAAIADKLYKGEVYNPSEILPDDPNFYMYDGSNTENNSEEGIRWIVMKKVRTASKEQIKAITNRDPSVRNIRPIQATQRRLMVETMFPTNSPSLGPKTEEKSSLRVSPGKKEAINIPAKYQKVQIPSPSFASGLTQAMSSILNPAQGDGSSATDGSDDSDDDSSSEEDCQAAKEACCAAKKACDKAENSESSVEEDGSA